MVDKATKTQFILNITKLLGFLILVYGFILESLGG